MAASPPSSLSATAGRILYGTEKKNNVTRVITGLFQLRGKE
jgi:hypothetical protein